jgi:hypothetical protein
MTTCRNCGTEFNVSAVREEYNLVLELDGELDYDKDGDGLCFNCAIPDDVASNITLGRSILMMNGEVDHDPDSSL